MPFGIEAFAFQGNGHNVDTAAAGGKDSSAARPSSERSLGATNLVGLLRPDLVAHDRHMAYTSRDHIEHGQELAGAGPNSAEHART